MNARSKSRRFQMVRRGAFTLIELMMVIVIIAALVALTASAVVKFIEVQQRSNTQSFLDRTQSQVNRAWSKVKDQAYTESIPVIPYDWIKQNLAGNDAMVTGRIRVLYVKLKLRQAFPMNFAEVFNIGAPAGLSSAFPTLPGYYTPTNPAAGYLGSLGITPLTYNSVPYEYQSAACLLMALQRGVSGAGINPEELTKGGATGSYSIPNGGSLPYLTDAWGRPIFFTRVPVGSISLNPNGAQVGANDPGDPEGYLNFAQWGITYGPTFSKVTLQQLAPSNPSSKLANSYKLAPMIASGGPVNWLKTGTTPPFDPITFASTPGNGAMFSNP